jgi:hypothetical protein
LARVYRVEDLSSFALLYAIFRNLNHRTLSVPLHSWTPPPAWIGCPAMGPRGTRNSSWKKFVQVENGPRPSDVAARISERDQRIAADTRDDLQRWLAIRLMVDQHWVVTPREAAAPKAGAGVEGFTPWAVE